jgi:hypothetical protein
METTKDIKKAKIREGKLEIEYELITRIDDVVLTDKITMIGGHEVHPDCRAAFDEMLIHLVELCELGQYHNLKENPELLADYSLTGFSRGGSDEHEGVTLIGRKDLSTKKVLNLVAPFTKFDPETTDYSRSIDLAVAVRKATDEVVAYLEGKFAPSLQLDLPFNVTSVEGNTVTIEMK